jgi:ABC-type uncharacterized transport system YnjBCD ATPase subunit
MAAKKKITLLENANATGSSKLFSGGIATLDVSFSTTGVVALERLGADETTWLQIVVIIQDDTVAIHLPDGTYRMRVDSGSGIYAQLVPTALS